MKLNLRLMYLVVFLQGLIFYRPVSLLYRIERGLTISEFFFLEFFMFVIIILTEVPWGYFADKFGYKKTLIISYSIFFLSRFSLLFCNSFPGFFIQTILTGIGGAGASGCDIAYLYNSCKEEESEKVFGRYSAYGSLSLFISSIASYFLIGISMEFAVVVTVIAYGISIVVLLFTKDVEKEVSSDKEKIAIKDSFKDFKNVKWIFMFVICISVISEVYYAVGTSLGQLHFESIGMDIRYLGYIVALSDAIGILACKTHIISKKLGQYNALRLFLVMISLCVLVLIFTNSIWISIVAISSMSGLIYMAAPISLDIKNKSITKNRATILSMYSMIGSLATAMINVCIGFVADIEIKYAFMVCFVIICIGISGVYLYIEKTKDTLEVLE